MASNLSAYCRNHHRLKHSGQWVHTSNPDRSVMLTSPTGHCYRTRPSGLLAGMLEPVLPRVVGVGAHVWKTKPLVCGVNAGGSGYECTSE